MEELETTGRVGTTSSAAQPVLRGLTFTRGVALVVIRTIAAARARS